VKYGKWVLLAGSIGMNYLAVRAHDRAENNFDALESRCGQDQARERRCRWPWCHVRCPPARRRPGRTLYRADIAYFLSKTGDTMSFRA